MTKNVYLDITKEQETLFDAEFKDWLEFFTRLPFTDFKNKKVRRFIKNRTKKQVGTGASANLGTTCSTLDYIRNTSTCVEKTPRQDAAV